MKVVIYLILLVLMIGCGVMSNRESLVRSFGDSEECVIDSEFVVFVITGYKAKRLFDQFDSNVLIDFNNKFVFILKTGKVSRTLMESNTNLESFVKQ
jgi:hypothetical protein